MKITQFGLQRAHFLRLLLVGFFTLYSYQSVVRADYLSYKSSCFWALDPSTIQVHEGIESREDSNEFETAYSLGGEKNLKVLRYFSKIGSPSYINKLYVELTRLRHDGVGLSVLTEAMHRSEEMDSSVRVVPFTLDETNLSMRMSDIRGRSTLRIYEELTDPKQRKDFVDNLIEIFEYIRQSMLAYNERLLADSRGRAHVPESLGTYQGLPSLKIKYRLKDEGGVLQYYTIWLHADNLVLSRDGKIWIVDSY